MEKTITGKGMEEANELFERIWDEIGQRRNGKAVGLKELLEMLMNHLMIKERQMYLLRHPDDRANGFYERRLGLRFADLEIKVPRVRIGNNFRPTLLPPAWKRVDKDYEELILGMLSNGYSRTQIKKTLKKLGLPYSEESLETVLELIGEKLEYFKNRTLPSDWLCIFIDAYHGKMRLGDGKIREISIYVAVGIDLEGYKHIIGFWVLRGRESKGFWTEVLQDMINRGVHRVLMFVTDDFSGLTSVVQRLFPGSDHQLCIVHLRRALKRKLEGSVYSRVSRLLHKLRHAEDEQEGHEALEAIAAAVEEEDKRYAKRLLQRAEHYVAFLKYPRQIRGHLYTTNPVEGLNRGIDLMRLELGGYFPSEECLEVNLFVQVVNLEDTWQRKPMPNVASCLYEIRQLWQMRFGLNEEEEIE